MSGTTRGLLTLVGIGWFALGLAVVYVVLSLVAAIALRLANGWVKATNELGLPSALRVSFASGLLVAALGAFTFSGLAMIGSSGSTRFGQEPIEYVAMHLLNVSDVAQTAFFVTLGNAVLFRQMLRGRDGEAMSLATACALALVQGALFAITWVMMCLATIAVVAILMR